MKGLTAPTAQFPFPTLRLDVKAMTDWLRECRDRGVKYGLGAKVPKHGSKDFTKVDCSGAVREMVWLGSGGTADIGDGSYNQHDVIKAAGLKVSSVGSAMLHDNIVRIAFLSPQDGGGVGHVVLVHNGMTLESHGGIGPDRRQWTGAGWQGKCDVYVLGVAK